MKGFLIIMIIIGLIILGPLVTLWALNTLFPALAIPYTFWTWLATLIVAGLFKSEVNAKFSR